ncbi:hypothetical protein D9Q98_002662 [Chlorella vulgaris]|uniref:USP domain-containing protein n=1 Tax=Chlorella vulgaris TaxID=3077 RepID=A0A9D4TUA5_CHLVU|nr:hypothetical protein D9Q98_002662 [Chlorella vulgaris]
MAEAKRNAEEKARTKAKKGKKPALAGSGGKGASKAGWREQLDEGEADSEREEATHDDAEAELETEPLLSPEGEANLRRLHSEFGQEQAEHGEGWELAGAAPRRSNGAAAAATDGAQPPLSPPARQQRSGLARGMPADVPLRRGAAKDVAGPPGWEPDSASSSCAASAAALPGWKFDDGQWSSSSKQHSAAQQRVRQQPEQQQGLGGASTQAWAQRAGAVRGQAGDDDDVESLLAAMDIGHGEPEEGEDAELAAAIAASLENAPANTLETASSAGGVTYPPSPPTCSTGVALPGLRNEVGEYNCFLNVIVQCLWRCGEFRQEVSEWLPDVAAAHPVLAALQDMFHAFQQQGEQIKQEEWGLQHSHSLAPWPAQPGHAPDGSPPALPSPLPAPPSAQRPCRPATVDPTALRVALGDLEGHGFAVGQMQDPAEVLLCLYDKVMEATAATGCLTSINTIFGLLVREEVACHRCGQVSHQSCYTQYFHHTQATTLRLLCAVSDSMGTLLREAEAQIMKSCDTDLLGCGTSNPVNHFLDRAPRVFTLQVAWESDNETPEAISGTLAALDEEVDLGEVYQGADRGLHRCRLRSMVCYYGQHYQALVLVPEAGGWLMFDDTRVTVVGSWADVRHKCEAGRIQPSVLFYEQA